MIKIGDILVDPGDIMFYYVKRYIYNSNSKAYYKYIHWDASTHVSDNRDLKYHFIDDVLYTDIFREMKKK